MFCEYLCNYSSKCNMYNIIIGIVINIKIIIEIKIFIIAIF